MTADVAATTDPEFDPEGFISYVISKHIPDMLSSGVQIETNYGTLKLNDRESKIIAKKIESMFLRRIYNLRIKELKKSLKQNPEQLGLTIEGDLI